MMIPGLKVVAPSSPVDVIGLMAAAVRDDDPVIFLEHKSLYAMKGEVPDGEIVDTLGTAKILRPGKDCTIVALALMVPARWRRPKILAARARHRLRGGRRALAGAARYADHPGLGCEDRPPVHRRGKSRGCCGWGAEIASIVADEAFWDLDGPIVRITTPHIPLPAADHLEDIAIPSAAAHRRDASSRVMNGSRR